MGAPWSRRRAAGTRTSGATPSGPRSGPCLPAARSRAGPFRPLSPRRATFFFGKPNRRAGRAENAWSALQRPLALLDREAPLVERLADDDAAQVHLPQGRQPAEVLDR